MMIRRPCGPLQLRSLLAAAALATAAVALATAPAFAAPPDAVGWWHRAVAEAPAVGGGLPEDARPTLVPVPDGGLYVANDASGRRAIAALRFPSATGSAAVLTLRISGEPFLPAGARLVACPVEPVWQPVANGSWEARPGLNCDRATDGAFEQDRSEVRFELSKLGAHRSPRGIEVAIAPADGEVAPFAVAFEAPAEEALRVTGETTSPAPPGATSQDSRPDVPHESGPEAPHESRPVRPPFPAPVPPPDTPVVAPSLEGAEEVAAETPLPAQAAEALPDAGQLPGITTDGSARAALTALFGLCGAAAWLSSGGLPRLRAANVPSARKPNEEIRP